MLEASKALCGYVSDRERIYEQHRWYYAQGRLMDRISRGEGSRIMQERDYSVP